jgi:hypothetical protein
MLYDPVRRKKVARTPEEEVRQKMIAWLHGSKQVPYEMMEVEVGLGRFQKGNEDRCDILVWNFRYSQTMPWLLVECKRPEESLGEMVEEQVERYLRVLKPQYIALTNGRELRIFSANQEEKGQMQIYYQEIPSMPEYS